MHVIKATYNANPNIGLFCYATDKYCLVPRNFSPKLTKKFEDVLKVQVHEMSAAGTDLLGVFFAGNSSMLLVPEIMFDSELKLLKELKIPFTVLKTEFTALGNNLIVNDKICIASSDYDDKVKKEIKDTLKIDVKTGKIAGIDTVGSLIALNTKGALVSNDIKDFEKNFLEDNLKVKVTAGSINFGSPYISSGIVCNSNGFVVGDVSGGPEIQDADEALGFLEG